MKQKLANFEFDQVFIYCFISPAKAAIDEHKNPIVIDNTNTQSWEMRYYVTLAVNNNYHIEIHEPDTPWKFKIKELAK